ncbi:MAG: hypothetical protein JWM80_113 [Cyanobacteria bacterium RYN_339]|nr:hypothetical protein [Cyanobacteria bacterium RYN_339]
MRREPPAPYVEGDLVKILDTPAAKKFGTPGVAGKVLGSNGSSTWILFKRAREDKDTWVPNEHLERAETPPASD